jgi:acyl-CoA thioesterase-1
MVSRRRQWLRALGVTAGSMFMNAARSAPAVNERFTVVTLGDSILDCARYNAYGVHPAQLIVRNDDRLFPQFKGRDLWSLGGADLQHRAQDGARVGDLPAEARSLRVSGPAVVLLTIGGNDLLGGLVTDRAGIVRFERQLDQCLAGLAIGPVLLGNVYDPTFGDDSRNFLGVDPRVARANFDRVNDVIRSLAARYGELVDVHRHFLQGDPSWVTQTIEPSLRGASEVRAAFLPAVLRIRGS